MTSSAPSVSICMPCYNAARFVVDAVHSVLEQTWRDLEIIVVNDGSTDGSAEALATISDPRLKVMSQSNRGQCAAANAAFAASRGALIKFFDADDVLHREHIALQVERLAGSRNAVAMGEWARFEGDDHTGAKFEALAMYQDAAPADWLTNEWMHARPMMQCGLWLIPREVLTKSGLWDESLSLINDFEFFSRVLLSASEIRYAPGARLYYRSGVTNSLSGQRSRDAVESAFVSLLKGTDHLLAADNNARSRLACANVLKDFDYTYYPLHEDLRAKVRARVAELGGSNLAPDGPPGFQRLRPFVGWKPARLAQHAVERLKRSAALHRKSP